MSNTTPASPATLKNPLDGLNKQQVKQLGTAIQKTAALSAAMEEARKRLADSRFMVKAALSAAESAKAVRAARASERVRDRAETDLAKLAAKFKDNKPVKAALALYQGLEKAAAGDPAARRLLDEVKADLTIATASVTREKKSPAAAQQAVASAVDQLLNGISGGAERKKQARVGELTEHARGEVEETLREQRKRREPNEFQEPAMYPPSLLARYTLRGNEVINKRTEEVAFVDDGRQLRAKGDVGKDIIDAMLDTAASRGWAPLKVFGTQAFKAAVWMEAASRGLDVIGYKPTPQEVAAAAHNRSLNGAENGIAGAPVKQVEKETASPEKGIVGKVVEHGEAKYNFDKDENPSYYVKLATKDGEKTVWGVDLQRALKDAGAKAGSEVRLENLGKQAVAVVGTIRDDKNKVVGRGPIDSHRNEWKATILRETEKVLSQGEKMAKAFLDASNARQRSTAVKEFPQLGQAFALLATFEAGLAKPGLSKSESRDFTDQFKDVVASRLERGKPLPTVEVRDSEKEKQRQEEDQEK